MRKGLFIVDIQEKYDKNFTEEYFTRVKDYIDKNKDNYEKIVMIMEENESSGDFISKEMHKNLSIRPVFKCYDSDYSIEKLKKSSLFHIAHYGNMISIN